MRNKVNEWQELSLKKDIENIYKTLYESKSDSSLLMVDIFMAVFSLWLDKVYNMFNDLWKCAVLTVVIAIPISIVIFRKIINKIRRHNSPYKAYSVETLVDVFDNKVCYYVLTAESYYQMLVENQDNQDNSVLEFYFTEIWYYINKAKSELFSMYNNENVFSEDSIKIQDDKLVLATRLKNIMDMIDHIGNNSNDLIKKISKISDLKINKLQFQLNDDYDQSYKFFVDRMKGFFECLK